MTIPECIAIITARLVWFNTPHLFNKLPHLDANQDAPVSDHFDEGHAIIRVLVQRLVEEDDPSNAGVDAIIGTEKDLPVLSAVLLRVLHSNLGQPLSHAACRATHKMHSVGWALAATEKKGTLLQCKMKASHVSTETEKEGKKSVLYRPTDSSAARMPFPLETMRRAVSCSSFFCASESEGNGCVILSQAMVVLQPWTEDQTTL